MFALALELDDAVLIVQTCPSKCLLVIEVLPMHVCTCACSRECSPLPDLNLKCLLHAWRTAFRWRFQPYQTWKDSAIWLIRTDLGTRVPDFACSVQDLGIVGQGLRAHITVQSGEVWVPQLFLSAFLELLVDCAERRLLDSMDTLHEDRTYPIECQARILHRMFFYRAYSLSTMSVYTCMAILNLSLFVHTSIYYHCRSLVVAVSRRGLT